MTDPEASSDRHADEGAQRKPILSLEQEALLLIIWGLGALWHPIGQWLFPQHYILPDRAGLVLLLLWFPAFIQWAAKGGLPRW